MKRESKAEPAPAQSGQHTPGPWNFGTHSKHIYGSDGSHIATMHGFVLGCNEADARLIAAAPELLEALRELLTSEESPHSETVRFLAREQARTILAKIGGKQ